MSEFQKILDCEHDFEAISGLYDCEKCGISQRSLNWVYVIVKLEARVAELLYACKLAEVHVGWDDCSLKNVHEELRAAIAGTKGR